MAGPAKVALSLTCLVLCLSQARAYDTVPETVVRIGIAENASSFNLGGESDCDAVELNTGKKTRLTSSKVWLVVPSENGIQIGEDEFVPPVRIVSVEENKFVRVNGRRYRDSLLLLKNGNDKLTVVNELGLDGYLYGILPREVSPQWPLESLKAQAVASRSYALKNFHRHDASGFNLCSTVHCQVYGGVEGETESTTRAVRETHNEVLTFDEDMVNAYFFANCGGHTEEPSSAWDSTAQVPYLKSVRCKFCRNEDAYEWERDLSEESLVNSLRRKGYPVSVPVQSIKINGRGRSGRARELIIRHSDGTLKIRASLFRAALGPDLIRSTMFDSIKKKRQGYKFRGRGWGHGVGLCQHGAKGMSLKGYSYQKILKFYYPGAKIQKWEE